jgi:DNA repair photolyase
VDLLRHEIKRKRVGRVWISGVCDPYQPLEARYKLTRGCLEVLLDDNWPVFIQTKSTLVLRDLDLLERFSDSVEVTLSITTGDDEVRRIFEPNSPSIWERIRALDKIHSKGVRTCVMIAPLLPGAENLVTEIGRSVDRVLVDKMNYHYADWVYKKYGMMYAKVEGFFRDMKLLLKRLFEKEDIPYRFLF